MVVVGARGLAKEVLEIFSKRKQLSSLYFFDNVNVSDRLVFDQFPILHSFDEVRRVFTETNDPSFVLGLGSPVLRQNLCLEFERIGGKLTSAIHPAVEVGSFDVSIGAGTIILGNTTITNSVTVGRGTLINPNCTISHDSVIGDFVEISPGVRITGHARVGDLTMLGTNCCILPRVKIGKNVVVGAGAVVRHDVADNTMVAGVPAVFKKKIDR